MEITPYSTSAYGNMHDAKARRAAEELEAGFLAEMLKSAGLGSAGATFGSDEGESQFASFLREAYAREMVRSGGIGLAEHIFEALKETPFAP